MESELSDVDAWAGVRDERVDVLALLRSLEPQQWDAPSLCAGWRVRDVAAHLPDRRRRRGDRSHTLRREDGLEPVLG